MPFFSDCLNCLLLSDPADKVQAVHGLYSSYYNQLQVESLEAKAPVAITSANFPGRPAKPLLVPPRKVKRRSLFTDAGQAALVHAICHIEFNAINLALDAAYRFRNMPLDYYNDWLSVAADEARHFGWLQNRLADMGHAYGDFDAHNGLWEMAEKTADNVMVRMALVPRVLEARGLDVTPGMIERLEKAGDTATVVILHRILEEEIPHVAIGSRWFRYCCELNGEDATQLFPKLLFEYMQNPPTGPFNLNARYQAGFSEREMQLLVQQLETNA